MRTPGRARVRRSTVILLVAVLLLAAGTWAAYFSPLLVVREVAVAGQRSVTAEEVVAAAAVPLGEPLARQDVQAIAERATRIPAVRAAAVTRRWPGTLLVTVTERSGVLAVKQADGYVLVDVDGVAYDRAASRPEGAILAEVDPGDQGLLREVGLVAGALPAELAADVKGLRATGPDLITLRLRSGVDVVWGSAADSPLKARIVLALLEQKPRQTINVSSPNSPAVK